MLLIYADETIPQSRERQGCHGFFCYGAVSIPADASPELSKKLEEIASELDPTMLPLKFHSDRRLPKDLQPEHREAKKAFMAAAAKAGAKFFCSIISLDVARPLVLREYQMNTLIASVHDWMGKQKEHGLVLIDTYDEQTRPRDQMERLFRKGLKYPGRPWQRLRRIVGFGESYAKSSHLPSLVDIALGNLRHAIHTCRKRNNLAMARALAKPLIAMEPKASYGPFFQALTLRPMKPLPKYEAEYAALIKYLQDLGLHPH
jgi:hypothetical protein